MSVTILHAKQPTAPFLLHPMIRWPLLYRTISPSWRAAVPRFPAHRIEGACSTPYQRPTMFIDSWTPQLSVG